MIKGLITFSGAGYRGSTNIRRFSKVLFSVKKKKFIRPGKRYGDSVSGYYDYIVYGGRYLLFNYEYWSKAEPAINFGIEMVILSGVNRYMVETVKGVIIKGEKNNDILEVIKMHGFYKCFEIVEDFMRSLPKYHLKPDMLGLTSKVYNEDSVNELVSFIDKFNGDQMYYNMEVE